ncbi:MAG: nucleoside 2-deoxyribosyltransferase [Nanoarchaeota archaeon]
MIVYIAGPLFSEIERTLLEEVNRVCKDLGFDTFLPHRDAGLISKGTDEKIIFKKDKAGIDTCQMIIAILSGNDIDSGTAWELGYAFSKNIKCIGLVTDSRLTTLNPMISQSAKLVHSIKELRMVLKNVHNL